MTTLYRLSEEIMNLLSGGAIQSASNVTINDVKISVAQVCNQLLKTEQLTINERMGEKIPNGTTLGWYEGISVSSYNGVSRALLPIKPIKLSRNMGIFSIYPKYTLNGNYEFKKEWIPVQMGQLGLIDSQPLFNNLLGQVGYENFGMEIITNIDVKALFPNVVLAMRLAIMDISLYSDYEPLPILPEMEWQIKQQVVSLYSKEPLTDLVVDVTSKQQQNVPVKQQEQTQ